MTRSVSPYMERKEHSTAGLEFLSEYFLAPSHFLESPLNVSSIISLLFSLALFHNDFFGTDL